MARSSADAPGISTGDELHEDDPPDAGLPDAGWRAALQGRWAALRERLLRSPAFHRAAQTWLPWVARRHAVQAFDLMAGFVYSQVLLAVVRLGLLERLARDGPQPASRLLAGCGLGGDGGERLLRAAVALRLLEPRPGGRFGLGRVGAPLAADAGLRALVLHHEALYRDLADPVALLRDGPPADGALARFWPYAGAPGEAGGEGAAAAYSALMAATQPMVAAQVLQAYPVRRHRRLLDVGGGEGVFACAAAAAAPALRVEVLDLPPVAERARRRLAAAGLQSRSTAWGGSFLHEPLPAGADLVTLVRVVHDHDDGAVRTLLAAVRRALAPGGRLLVAEPLADTPGAPAMGDAYFGLYLHAMGSGRPRSAAALTALLQEAGFGRVTARRTRLPLLASVLVADTDRLRV